LTDWPRPDTDERQVAPISQPIERNTLALWDTGRYAAGRYDLRLRLVFPDGNYDEYRMPGIVVVR
ncbi:MAG: hypothetical protein WAV60_10090, partial [Anaerolineae bacterium]